MLQNIFILFLLFSAINANTECLTIKMNNTIASTNLIRLVQYNVEWLFIDYYNTSNCPGNGCTWKNISEASTHMDYVATVINDLKPDILNLCEVEGCDELNMLTNMLADNYTQYLKKGSDTTTGQNVGMLTKIQPIVNLYRTEEKVNYPISGSNCNYTGTPGTSGVTKHYITEFNISNINIVMIGVHLLAYPDDVQRCAQREAQAQVLQNVVFEYYKKNYEIILLGDLNDFDNNIDDSNNNKPISKVLDILKGNFGYHAFEYELYNVAETIPKSERYSDWWDKNNDCISSSNEFSLIDHVLVTKNLKYKIVNSYVYHGYPEFCGKYNSDHYPIVVDFIL